VNEYNIRYNIKWCTRALGVAVTTVTSYYVLSYIVIIIIIVRRDEKLDNRDESHNFQNISAVYYIMFFSPSRSRLYKTRYDIIYYCMCLHTFDFYYFYGYDTCRYKHIQYKYIYIYNIYWYLASVRKCAY